MHKIILASNSKVRKKILDENEIECKVVPSNIDEDSVKKSLLRENASPEVISKNLAELKANKISLKLNDQIVLGADSVIDINKELISKPKDREEAFKILKKLKIDYLYKPSYADIYKFKTKNKIYLDKFAKELCGEFRKGHFRGVIDVVNRLLEIINPKILLLLGSTALNAIIGNELVISKARGKWINKKSVILKQVL